MYDRYGPRTGVNQKIPPQSRDGASESRYSNGHSGYPGGDQSDGAASNAYESQLEGVYIISVAARLLEMHPQTLRKYERLGLIRPCRTVGMLRLYSWEDIQKLRLIRHLMDNLGLNLAGVELALALVDNLLYLKKRVGAMTEGTPLKEKIDQEIAQVFQNLNLPLEP